MIAPKLRGLGLALIATFAMSAAASSAAHAGEFEADQYPVTFTGHSIGKHLFETVAGTVACNVSYHGEASATLSEMPLTTTYSECSLGGGAATMTFVKCHTRFTAGNTVEGTGNPVAIETHFKCETGGSIVIKAPFCEITIETNQTFTQGLAHNQTMPGGKGEFEVEMAFEGVKYVIEPNGLCGPSGTYENGVYRGTVTVEGEKPSEASSKIGVTVT
jgi:hypothetical protein